MLRLKSGEQVVDRYRSHLHDGVVALLPVALGQIESQGREFFSTQVDFGRVIGKTICVETGPNDEIVFAQRRGRAGLSRFILNRHPTSTSSLVIILKKAEDDNLYVIVTAFTGALPEPEPWDRNATERSREFWSTHALVWGVEKIVPGTLTRECPW